MLKFLKHLHVPFDFKLKTFFISQKSNYADQKKNVIQIGICHKILFCSQCLSYFRLLNSNSVCISKKAKKVGFTLMSTTRKIRKIIT